MKAESILRRHICPLLFSLVCVLIALLPESFITKLQYQRIHITDGELWRLFSAHLTHLGWGHLIMNLAGFWLILALFPKTQPPLRCMILLVLLILGTSIGLWLFSPEVTWYRGLSGVLHGLLCWGALKQLKEQPGVSFFILTFVVIKLIWEQWQGPLPGSESLAAGNVIVDAHLYGAVTGVILWSLGSVVLKLVVEETR
ncbi:MAG: rhombosortase [Candidatus Thiodiazotropha endolucinida]|nr:rhombosortase [Candidatus Thiodiazotropha taylori]MCW4226750.1 rhombosortase [Candidatus Thiodiazotropha endolucinida]MCG7881895.1 rhombosortase [Candidatus Thiodiazotropha taylori]MCG7888312.1 rhombosortase [Candidatus Thiodiazotropha taylori]MCG7891145.1 rhombosortase [Candidatus Thiodiazotropha taylori]